MTPFDGKCQNLQTSPNIFALALTISDIQFLDIRSEEIRSWEFRSGGVVVPEMGLFAVRDNMVSIGIICPRKFSLQIFGELSEEYHTRGNYVQVLCPGSFSIDLVIRLNQL